MKRFIIILSLLLGSCWYASATARVAVNTTDIDRIKSIVVNYMISDIDNSEIESVDNVIMIDNARETYSFSAYQKGDSVIIFLSYGGYEKSKQKIKDKLNYIINLINEKFPQTTAKISKIRIKIDAKNF